jgi:hypothetical protein
MEVAPRAQRPAVVLLGPAVRRQKGPGRLADVALALAHVRLHQPGPMPEQGISGQIGGLGDGRRAGQDRVDVMALMILKIIQLSRQVRRGTPHAGAIHGRDGSGRRLNHPTPIGNPSPI